ncbi:hypothetical protein NDU88_000858 [Pleurodeles waltl]|uniref:Uncharacterized protein n=1 Tax=Pleurodeles waltl TaxID=8319 RepID=A0AAV7VVX0_PLEWA|nr:hypothetical protein NDU88_000858 [Pleurodeles waltl]
MMGWVNYIRWLRHDLQYGLSAHHRHSNDDCSVPRSSRGVPTTSLGAWWLHSHKMGQEGQSGEERHLRPSGEQHSTWQSGRWKGRPPQLLEDERSVNASSNQMASRGQVNPVAGQRTSLQLGRKYQGSQLVPLTACHTCSLQPHAVLSCPAGVTSSSLRPPSRWVGPAAKRGFGPWLGIRNSQLPHVAPQPPRCHVTSASPLGSAVSRLEGNTERQGAPICCVCGRSCRSAPR